MRLLKAIKESCDKKLEKDLKEVADTLNSFVKKWSPYKDYMSIDCTLNTFRVTLLMLKDDDYFRPL